MSFVAKRLSSLLVLLTSVLAFGGCGEKAKKDGRFDEDTVVAIVGSTSITYGQIRFKYSDPPDVRKEQELEASRNPEQFWRIRERQERLSLQGRVFRALFDAGIEKHGIIVAEEEIQERAKQTMAKQVAKNPGLAATYEEAVDASRLMCMWVEDKEEAEVAYRREFAETISKASWERMKARLESGLRPHRFTIEDLEEGNRRVHVQTAQAYCLMKRLVARLVELGVLEQGQGIDTWRWRQLSTVEFPVEELKISPDEKDTFHRWDARRKPRARAHAAAEQPVRADGEGE